MNKQTEALKLALEKVQEFKGRWWKVPPFGNKVNKATREAITNAHSPIFELEHAIREALADQPAIEFTDKVHIDVPDQPLFQKQPAQQEPVEISGVKETLEEGVGMWRECTGCYETNEGYPPKGAYFSKVFKCYLGNGCDECGGIGAIWDNTDYEEMAKFMMEEGTTPQAQPAQQQEPVATYHGSNDFGHEVVELEKAIPIGAKLYTSPPASKPWVGLSTIELDEIDAPIRERGHATIAEIYRAIEAKLKEKNA